MNWCLGWPPQPPHVVDVVEVTADGIVLCGACWTRRETEGPWS